MTIIQKSCIIVIHTYIEIEMLSRIKFDIDKIVEYMLDKLPKSVWTSTTTTFLDPALGGGQFVRAVEKRLKKYGHSDSNISQRVFGFESSLLNVRYAVNKYKLVGQYKVGNFSDEDIINMKFDVILTNPPYHGKGYPEHLKFLNKAYKFSNQYILFLHPSTYLVDNKKENEYYQNARNLIKDNLIDITLFTKDVFESAQLNTGVAGIVVDRNTFVNNYSVTYHNLSTVVKFNDIEDINIFACNSTYLSIKKKLLNLASKRSIQDDVQAKGDWCVPIPKLQRYRFLPDRAKVCKAKDLDGDHAARYPTKELAECAYNWLLDPVAILALHIYKQDMNIASGRNLRSVPSFTKVDDFKNAYNLIGLSQDEIDWCKNIFENSTTYIKFS